MMTGRNRLVACGDQFLEARRYRFAAFIDIASVTAIVVDGTFSVSIDGYSVYLMVK